MSGIGTDIAGVRIGHAQDFEARTGCTVILFPAAGCTAGLASCGAAPATRELDLLRIDGITQGINAVLLTGGSAFGLDAAGGVMTWLEEREIGFDTGVARVPLVPTVSIFDLAWGSATTRPDAEMAMRACDNAVTGNTAAGSIGVGTGATVGKLIGMDACSPSGVAYVSDAVGDVKIGVVAVANAFGDLVDFDGEIVAGARNGNGNWLDSEARITADSGRENTSAFSNCSFAVVFTDMKLNRREATRLAEMAFCGLSRVIRPAHTMYDFDAVIAVSCGDLTGDVHAIGAKAAELVQRAVIRGAREAAQTV